MKTVSNLDENSNLVSSSPICDLYSKFTLFLLKHLFGENHVIVVGAYLQLYKQKKTINIYIITGSKWYGKVIGKSGNIIHTIENLLKIKGYLNKYQVKVNVEK